MIKNVLTSWEKVCEEKVNTCCLYQAASERLNQIAQTLVDVSLTHTQESEKFWVVWPLPWVILSPGGCMNTDLAEDLSVSQDVMCTVAALRSYLVLVWNGQKDDGNGFYFGLFNLTGAENLKV